MIAALIALKRKCPGLWNRVEDVNGLLFRIRYRRLPEKATEILKRREVAGYRYSLLEEMDLPELNAFLNAQPAENLIWFHPHLFDAKTLRRLWRNPAFLMMQVTAPDGRMAGYFFLRGFFIGRAFAGLIVDRDDGGERHADGLRELPVAGLFVGKRYHDSKLPFNSSIICAAS
ncbi:MAG: hypothetical protein IJQ93_11810, partial [Bacteroidales bacterium]|nr:hypothetical protein [Bacteroidales bacterium]